MSEYTNTKETIGVQATLDGLVAHTLTDFTDTDAQVLGSNAFYGQKQLESITLPNVESIDSYAFYNCTGLKYIRIGLEKNTVCTLKYSNAITHMGHTIIYVPSDLVSAYKSATNWSMRATKIFADGDPNAPEWNETEITDSDSEIFERINNGTAASYYKLGQYKKIQMGSTSMSMQIVGINADALADNSGQAQLTWISMAAFGNYSHRMNPSLNGTTEGTGAIGGWDKSELKSYIYETIWPLIPSGWQNIIKEVKKYTRIYNTSGTVENNVITSEKIWIPSARETNCDNSSYRETLGPNYHMAFASPATRARWSNNYSRYWWTRSAGSNAQYFTAISPNDGVWTYTTNPTLLSYYIVLGFCT